MSSSRWTTVVAMAVSTVTVGAGALWLERDRPAPRVLSVELPAVEIVGRAERETDPRLAYFAGLRAKLRWVPTQVGRDTLLAPDHESRMMLSHAAARHAGLKDLGLTHKDVYAIINAETSWVPRRGSSRDGTPNLGLAQFEPATARALGVRDPDDAVEAVHAAAMHIKEAAFWSRDRIKGLKLSKAQRAEKLREGISIYYNLSTRGRNQWNGTNTDALPVETQRHIVNARLGAQEAAMLDAQLKAKAFAQGREVMTATAIDTRS